MKSNKYCILCGKPAHGVHHWIFGKNHKMADKDGIYSPICDECHLMGASHIHDDPIAETLSKALGQVLYERNEALNGKDLPTIKREFRAKYTDCYFMEDI